MAKEKAREAVNEKRMWVRITKDAHKDLVHLSVDLEEGVERLAGQLLTEAVRRARADFAAGKLPPKRR